MVKIIPFLVYNVPRQDIIPLDACGLIKMCDVDCCLTPLPEQVRLSGTSDNSIMFVAWVQMKSHGTSVVQYGFTPFKLDQTADPFIHTYTSGNWKGFIYNATISGLLQGTRYYYRVGSWEGGWSPIYKFKTFFNTGYQALTTTWGVIGDMGANWQSTNTVNRLIDLVANDQIDGILHNGDIAYADGVQRRVRISRFSLLVFQQIL